MTKGIFLLEKISKEKVDGAIDLGCNALFVGHQNLEKEAFLYAKSKGLKMNVEVGIFVGEDLWGKYPDSRPVDKQGRPMEKIHWYAGVCPTNPQVRKDRLDLIKKLVNEYDIDGIWLDFIRYPCHWEAIRSPDITEYCFCKNCLSKFEGEVGGNPEGGKWLTWKCEQITDFVVETKSIIESSKKIIELGMFLVPWKENDYDGSIQKIIGQDSMQLKQYCDTFSPMTYHRFTGNSPSWIREVISEVSSKTRKKILPLVQTEDRAGKITRKEFEKSLKYASQKPSEGVIIFFLEDLQKDLVKLDVSCTLYS